MKAKLEAIQNDFNNQLDNDETAFGLKQAVAALEKLGFSRHIACVTVTHWGMEYGLFDPEIEDVAEKQAEAIVNQA
jgi:hypothetical protein